jgi:hypothetical protein
LPIGKKVNLKQKGMCAMTTEITTVIGQFSIVNGIWHNDAMNQVAVREPKSADVMGAGKGDLFVLTEVHGQDTDLQALEQQLAEIFRDTYYMARGSITASLRRAMQVTGSMLYDRNYAIGVEKRIVGGLVAAVVDGEDVFVAQIGSTACFTVLGDNIRRYPTYSAWLDEVVDPAIDDPEPLLGTNLLVNPKLHHLRISPEDVLVLADSGLAGQLPLEDVSRSVNGSNVKTAVKNLGSVAKSRDCSALILAAVETTLVKKVAAPQEALPTTGDTVYPNLPHAAPQQAAPGKLLQWFNPWGGKLKKTAVSPEYLRSSKGQDLPRAEAGSPSRQWGETVTEEAMFDDEYPRETSKKHGKVMASVAAGTPFQARLQPGRAAGEGASFNPLQVFGWLGTLFGVLGTGLLIIIAFLGNGIKLILSPLLTKNNDDDNYYRQAGMQANRDRSSGIPWKLLLGLAIAIPLLVAVTVGVSYLQKGRVLESEYTELLTTAQTKFEQSQAVDQSAAMGLLAEVRTLLAQAEQIKPDQPEIAELRQSIADHADKLGNVQRLYLLSPLRQYTDSGTNLSQIVIQGVDVYVLDTGNDTLYHHQMDDLGEALLADNETFMLATRGQAVDDITVGDIQGMTWMPVGGSRQTSDMVILNSSGLLEYHPNWGVAGSTLASHDTLVSPVAVSSFFGNLYVLDPAGNQLLRYLPTSDGYNALPESYFPADQTVDLTGAVDLAIDGAIYLLYQDGRITKYLSGQPTDFNITGLDQPFNNPTSIHTAPNEEMQFIYVADTGNQRIVQLNKDGSFVRQFKPRQGEAVGFTNLQDIYVDEIGGRLYALDNNTLYVGNIPTEPV